MASVTKSYQHWTVEELDFLSENYLNERGVK
jgi:hypothetical protein